MDLGSDACDRKECVRLRKENATLQKQFDEISANAVALEAKWIDALDQIDKLKADP